MDQRSNRLACRADAEFEAAVNTALIAKRHAHTEVVTLALDTADAEANRADSGLHQPWGRV